MASRPSPARTRGRREPLTDRSCLSAIMPNPRATPMSCEQPLELALDIGPLGGGQLPPSYHHDIERAVELGPPEQLTHAPPGSVPDDRAADLPGRGYPQPAMRESRGEREDG